MSHRPHLLLLIIFLATIGTGSLRAQTMIQVHQDAGRMLKINPIFPEITQTSLVTEVSIARMTTGDKAWHARYKYPEVGFSLTYHRLGNPDAFGHAIGALAFISHRWVDKPLWQLRARLGTGLAYITRPYDRISNPVNNILGSHLNSYTYLKLQTVFFPKKPTQYVLGIGYHHFSNSNTSIPNIGVNYPTLALGVRHFIQSPTPSRLAFPEMPAAPKGLQIGVRLGYGFLESKTPGGPDYPVYLSSVYLMKQHREKLRFRVGVEAFINYASIAWVRNFDIPDEDPFWSGLGTLAFVGAEWMMGRVSIISQIGPYLVRPYQMDYLIYTKSGLQYYLKDQQLHPRMQPFVGAYVHSHTGEADFLELAVGWVF